MSIEDNDIYLLPVKRKYYIYKKAKPLTCKELLFYLEISISVFQINEHIHEIFSKFILAKTY